MWAALTDPVFLLVLLLTVALGVYLSWLSHSILRLRRNLHDLRGAVHGMAIQRETDRRRGMSTRTPSAINGSEWGS